MNFFNLELEAQMTRLEMNMSKLERSIELVDMSHDEMLKGLEQCEVALNV